ncbi:Hypothetical protein MCYN_0167 [Mycoplasmopsis cynos C142]|uniref:Uncharacterized protein n=1 Tax=Mycoplasmopsis cynos (strain C142) TaxID=1246955 RepID=L0RUD5_MYCC1|nr:Hypothetical protein MCYN_0167 [Mycoplasmopsis cynos C142]
MADFNDLYYKSLKIKHQFDWNENIKKTIKKVKMHFSTIFILKMHFLLF